jgi:hypothetical protein
MFGRGPVMAQVSFRGESDLGESPLRRWEISSPNSHDTHDLCRCDRVPAGRAGCVLSGEDGVTVDSVLTHRVILTPDDHKLVAELFQRLLQATLMSWESLATVIPWYVPLLN